MKRNIRLLAWFNFFTDFKLYAPLAIIYFTQVSGSFAAGMSVFSVVMVSSALFEIPTGIYSDMIGRKKTVSLGAACAVFYSLFYALGSSYWFLIIGALFEGLSRSFYSGNNEALLYDTLKEEGKHEEYHHYLGSTSSMFQAALAVSALIGSVLAEWSFPLIMWLSVIPQAACLMLSLFLREPTIRSTESGNAYAHLKEACIQLKTNKRLRMLTIPTLLTYAFGESSYQFQSAFFNTLWPIWAVGFAKTLINVLATVSYRKAGTIIKKFGAIQVMLASNIYNRFVNIIAAAIPTIFSPLLMASTSLFFGISQVSKSTLFQREFRDNQRATQASLGSFLGNLTFGVVAYLVGLIGDKFTPAQALLFANLCLLPTTWMYYRIFQHEKNNISTY